MRTRTRLGLLLTALLALAACASQGRVYDGVDERAPAPDQPTTDVRDAAPSTEPSTMIVADATDACVMLYECGCNSGCVSVEAPRRGLREGVLVRVKTGSLTGQQLWVAKQKTSLGEEIFTVQQRDPKDEIQVCGGALRRSALGYACATEGAGPARRCGQCPAD